MNLHPATDKARALARIGSFWVEGTTPRTKELMRTLTRMGELVNAPYQLQALAGQLVGETESCLPYLTVKFGLGDVAVIGRDMHTKIRTELQLASGERLTFYRLPDRRDGGFANHSIIEAFTSDAAAGLGSESCQFLAFPDRDANPIQVASSDWALHYLVAIPANVKPSGILTPTRNLLAGVDFEVSEGCLLFQENPHDLFPEGFMTLMGCRSTMPNPFDYTYGVDPFFGPGDTITNFQRVDSSPAALEKAAATAAGLVIAPFNGVVSRRFDHCQGSRYVTASGVLDVPYKHSRKQVGDAIVKGEIMGGGLKLYWRTGSPGWHRAVDWSSGLQLDNLCPVPGVILPDRNCRCWAEGSSGGKLLTRIDMGNTSEIEDAFWSHVRTSEDLTGLFLNDVIGLTDVNDVRYINPLDFYFEQYFGDRAVVAHLRLRGVSEEKRRRAIHFLQTERLVGTLLFVKDDLTTTSDESLDSAPALSYLLKGGSRYENNTPPFAV